MKLQLVQREIEEGVRAYLRTIISVNDGMVIDMDFSATRGADGLIANIDIHPEGSESSLPPQEAPTPAPAATPAKPAAAPRAAAPRPVLAPKPVVVETQEALAAAVSQDDAPAIRTDPENRVDPSDLPTSEEANRDLEVEGGAPLKPSIFGKAGSSTFAGLKRPGQEGDEA